MKNWSSRQFWRKQPRLDFLNLNWKCQAQQEQPKNRFKKHSKVPSINKQPPRIVTIWKKTQENLQLMSSRKEMFLKCADALINPKLSFNKKKSGSRKITKGFLFIWNSFASLTVFRIFYPPPVTLLRCYRNYFYFLVKREHRNK